MDEEKNEYGLPLTYRRVPANLLGSRRIGGFFKMRNLIEGLILGAGISAFIFFLTPFKLEVKVLFMIIFGIFGIAFGIMGIANRSITQYIIARVLFNAKARKYHKRDIRYVKKLSSHTTAEGESLSYAEAIIYNFRLMINDKKENNEKIKFTDIIEIFQRVKPL